jgi:cytochrome b561
MIRSEAQAFTLTQKRLHWAVVLLLLLQYLFFDEMGRPFRRVIEGNPPVYSITVIAHIAIGVTVLLLAAWRLTLRRRNGVPNPPDNEPDFATTVSKVVHVTFYVLLFSLPIIGLGAWFLQIGLLGEIHQIGTTVLMWLAFAHVGAVLVHQFWWKTRILSRMT